MGQSLHPERQSAALFNLDRLKGLRDRGIFTDPRGQQICGRGRNSSSWADSSAVHNRPVQAFEVETRGSPVHFKVARSRSAAIRARGRARSRRGNLNGFSH